MIAGSTERQAVETKPHRPPARAKTILAQEDVHARFCLLRVLKYPRSRSMSEVLNSLMDEVGAPPSPLLRPQEEDHAPEREEAPPLSHWWQHGDDDSPCVPGT